VNSRNRLATLTGRYPGVYEQSLNEEKEIPVYEGRIPAPLPLDVLNARPDVRQAEANLKETIAGIGIAETEYFPSFQLTGQISLGTSDTSGAPSIDVLISSLGFLIDQVITAGGARAADVDIARARADEALADYERTLRSVTEEIETALAAIRASRERQDSLEKAVASSTRSFHQAESLYQLGLISFLDVVDAQRVLANAEQQLAAERTNYATQVAVLFRALGTGRGEEGGTGT
jgi:outer membrane protein TolC